MRLDSDALTPGSGPRVFGRRACGLLLMLGLEILLVRSACAHGRRGPPLGDAPRPYVGVVAADTANAVIRTTLAILEYVRWPDELQEVRLCVVGVTPYAGKLLASREAWSQRGRRLSVRQRTARDASADCDALFMGQLPATEAHALHLRIADEARITIGEVRGVADVGRACDEKMFCLDPRGRGKVGFVVNRHALARSGIRVPPGVLQLGAPRADGI